MQPSHIIKKSQPYDFHHYPFICIVPSLSQGCNPPVCHVSKPCSVPFPLHFPSVHLFFTMSVQFSFPIALRLPFFYQPIIKKQHRKRCIGSFLCLLPVPCLPVPFDRRSMLCGRRPTIATAGGSFRSVTRRGTDVSGFLNDIMICQDHASRYIKIPENPSRLQDSIEYFSML
jgi:hypothetical protein